MGDLKGAITNIAGNNPNEGKTPEEEGPSLQELRIGGFSNGLLDEVSK